MKNGNPHICWHLGHKDLSPDIVLSKINQQNILIWYLLDLYKVRKMKWVMFERLKIWLQKWKVSSQLVVHN